MIELPPSIVVPPDFDERLHHVRKTGQPLAIQFSTSDGQRSFTMMVWRRGNGDLRLERVD